MFPLWKRGIMFAFFLSSRNSFTSHRLSMALANSSAAQAWLKQRTLTWVSLHQTDLQNISLKSQLVPTLFQAEFLPLLLTLAVFLFDRYSLEKAYIQSPRLYQTHFHILKNSKKILKAESFHWLNIMDEAVDVSIEVAVSIIDLAAA